MMIEMFAIFVMAVNVTLIWPAHLTFDTSEVMENLSSCSESRSALAI